MHRRLRGHKQAHSSGDSGKLCSPGFSKTPIFFAGVNIKDHRAQCCTWAILLGHPQVRKELVKTSADCKGGEGENDLEKRLASES